jgi:hypothetical protein
LHAQTLNYRRRTSSRKEINAAGEQFEAQIILSSCEASIERQSEC